MGLAKYAEDNLEIMYEREYMMKSPISQQNSEVKYSHANTLSSLTSAQTEESTGNHCKSEPQKCKNYFICCDCGKKITLSPKTLQYFEQKGWQSPKRCSSCKTYKEIRILMRAPH